MGVYRGRLVGERVGPHPVFRVSLYVGGTMVLLAMLLAALIITPGSDSSVHAAAAPDRPAGCARTMAIARHLLAEQLHSDPAGWSMTERTDLYGVTIPTGVNTTRVEISTSAPCRVVPSIVRHEWMHQQQMRWFGRTALDKRGDIEIMADCGSWMLGSRDTPYVDQARRTGTGCTTVELDYARAIITSAGVAIVRQP